MEIDTHNHHYIIDFIVFIKDCVLLTLDIYPTRVIFC